ncbi:MAG: hypothetical protein A3D92_21430 [Bacteroidetes bacterium RIFCSPHIGHO2_02_FULL_44_7]|nr:MAG: hypothetical protein A3D92_21430 [Bacteroidetes bacterium RIFCSPHIGHO2_02_FULL_44_7]
MIWAYLLHLSYNMWYQWDCPDDKRSYLYARRYMRCSKKLWRELTNRMVDAGINMLVIDLGDGIQYKTHPEIAVRGAWRSDEVQEELARMRGMGLEPIPKLNFSAGHDAWLGPYSRCVSTEMYYRVCRDLIAEVIKVFRPRFFHLGMDEETAQHQRYNDYIVIRQFNLWWHDMLYLAEQVHKAGVRPWIWSDCIWNHRNIYLKRMPKTIIQSNWYYNSTFNSKKEYVRSYHDLHLHGYEQIPTGSNYYSATNFVKLVNYCKRNISSDRLLGFLQTCWQPTLNPCRERHIQAIEQVRLARLHE